MGLKERFFGRLPVAVARSLREHPEAWTSDARLMGSPHELTHASAGLTLWVANGSYGMAVHTGARRGSFSRLWGGVTMLSAVRLSPGHRYLRQAANAWLRGSANDAVRAVDDAILALAGAATSKAEAQADA